MRRQSEYLNSMVYLMKGLKSCCTVIILSLPSIGNAQQLLPQDLIQDSTIQLTLGDLVVHFIDNSALVPEHRAGYNGIAGLYHLEQEANIFVPTYAGFNLEHIFAGDSLIELFEPRKHPMQLYQKGDTEVLLYQAATPLSKVESLTQFKLVEPCYIDIDFSCILHDSSFFGHDYAGLFWASYINEPDDKRIYFEGLGMGENKPRWISAFSESHGDKSTHLHVEDKNKFYFAEDFNARLASHFSNYFFSEYFYFGRYRNMVLAYFFQSDQIIRFSQSPTGGGVKNPAWDFQFLIPHPVVGKIYSFKARLVYKPFVSSDDVRQEYKKWISRP